MKICIQCRQVIPGHSSALTETDESAVGTLWKCTHCGFCPSDHEGAVCFAPETASNSEGFKPHYFEMLANLEAGHFWYRARNQLILWGLKTYFPDAANFLEIGCGTGFVISGIQRALPGMNCYGSEIFPEGLVFAKQRLPKASFWQMDARRIPFVDEFDLVGSFDVIEHIEEDETVIAQMFQAIKPGGGLLLTVPQHKALWSGSDVRACHVRRYEANELRDKVKNAGFEILDETSFVSLLVPLMWLSRKLERDTTVAISESSEFDINPILNTCFYQIMLLEQQLLKLGIRFQIGGSRFLIARKPK